MQKIILTLLSVLTSSISYGQSLEDLYRSKNFQEMVKYEKKADKLTPQELYLVGFAFFQLENDEKAIQFYDKAMAKGLDSGYVHFYKGLSLNYSKKYNEALKELDIAIGKESNNQEYLNEKGLSYSFLGQLDKALEVFLAAEKLPNTFQAPFYNAPHVYHLQNNYKKALEGYYYALNHISKDNRNYILTLMDIGKLEYTINKDYTKAAWAYSQVIKLDSSNYDAYYKLMKAYNSAGRYTGADTIFNLEKIAFDNNKLPSDVMGMKSVQVAEFEWNGHKAVIDRSLAGAKKELDILYKVFVLNEAGDNIERRFMVEETIPLPDGPKNLLCEKDKKSGTHYTYSYGWKTDNVPIDDLEKAVELILDGKMKPAASSNFGN